MRVILTFLVIVICGTVPLQTMGIEKMDDRLVTQKLVDTARDIIIEGVKFGLDEAGGRLLGPTAWKGFKQVMSPVVKRLEQRFPALSFGKPEDKKAATAAQDAAEYLQHNSELQMLLLENFNKLEKGQADILAGIRRLERLTEKTSKDVADIKQFSQEILAEVRKQGAETTPSGLPDWVDVSDIVDQTHVLMNTQARRRGEELNPGVVTLLLMGVGVGAFMQRVLEDGQTLKNYKCRIGGLVYTMYTTGKYLDKDGTLCRNFTMHVPVLTEPQRHLVSTQVACQTGGLWRPLKILDEREYRDDSISK